jgi:hypothetical protein
MFSLGNALGSCCPPFGLELPDLVISHLLQTAGFLSLQPSTPPTPPVIPKHCRACPGLSKDLCLGLCRARWGSGMVVGWNIKSKGTLITCPTLHTRGYWEHSRHQ